MQLTVCIEHPDGSTEWVPAPVDREIYVGRDESNHIVLKSPEVSRRHLVVRCEAEGSYLVTDTSANGTKIGELALRGGSTHVNDGTPMRIGSFALRVFGPGQNPRANIEPKDAPTIPPPPDADDPSVVPVAVRKRMHALLLENLDLATLDRTKMDAGVMRPKVRAALRRIAGQVAADLPKDADIAVLIDELCDEVLGLGPLETLLADDTIDEIMVVDPETIYVERRGKVERSPQRFTDQELVRSIIERIVTPLGRRIDESTPVVDARLADGSRVHAIIPPLAIRGPCITIRKFAKVPLRMKKLIEYGTLTAQMGRFLERCVRARKNILVSGGTGTGKTTLLNVLSGAVPPGERIITIEDAAELQLVQPHVVGLESRRANIEGRGEYPIRELVRNALRMRPDRIIVGEVRGGEALDMLQAMNTGHEGSMTTTHANSPEEALDRLETLALMGGLELSVTAVRKQIASAVDIIVQQERFTSDGTRRITSITEIVGLDKEGGYERHELFTFEQTGVGPGGAVIGEFRATGFIPTFIQEFFALGLVEDGAYL
jgi:pilus assembly protein CpaF